MTVPELVVEAVGKRRAPAAVAAQRVVVPGDETRVGVRRVVVREGVGKVAEGQAVVRHELPHAGAVRRAVERRAARPVVAGQGRPVVRSREVVIRADQERALRAEPLRARDQVVVALRRVPPAGHVRRRGAVAAVEARAGSAPRLPRRGGAVSRSSRAMEGRRQDPSSGEVGNRDGGLGFKKEKTWFSGGKSREPRRETRLSGRRRQAR